MLGVQKVTDKRTLGKMLLTLKPSLLRDEDAAVGRQTVRVCPPACATSVLGKGLAWVGPQKAPSADTARVPTAHQVLWELIPATPFLREPGAQARARNCSLWKKGKSKSAAELRTVKSKDLACK